MSDTASVVSSHAEERPEGEEVEEVEAGEESENGSDDGDNSDEGDASGDEGKEDEDEDEKPEKPTKGPKFLSNQPNSFTDEDLGAPLSDYFISQLTEACNLKKATPSKDLFNARIIPAKQLAEQTELEGEFKALLTVQQYNPLDQWATAPKPAGTAKQQSTKNKKNGKNGKNGKKTPAQPVKGKKSTKSAWVTKAERWVLVTELKKVGVVNIEVNADKAIGPEESGASGPVYYQASFGPLPEDDADDAAEDDKKKNSPIKGLPLPQSGRVMITIFKMGDDEGSKERLATGQVRFNTGTIKENTSPVLRQTTLAMPMFKSGGGVLLKPAVQSILQLPIEGKKAGKNVRTVFGDIEKACFFFVHNLEGAGSCPQAYRVIDHQIKPMQAYKISGSGSEYVNKATGLAASRAFEDKATNSELNKKVSNLAYSINWSEDSYVRGKTPIFKFSLLDGGEEVEKNIKACLKIVLDGQNYQQLDTPARHRLEQAKISSFKYQAAQTELATAKAEDEQNAKKKGYTPIVLRWTAKLNGSPRPIHRKASLTRLSDAEIRKALEDRGNLFNTNPYPTMGFSAPYGPGYGTVYGFPGQAPPKGGRPRSQSTGNRSGNRQVHRTRSFNKKIANGTD